MRSESRPFGALTPGADWHKNGCPFQCIDFCSHRVTTRDCPHWLLALSIPFSRSDSVQARATDEAEVPGHHWGGLRGLPHFLRSLPPAGSRPVSAESTRLGRGHPALERLVTIRKRHLAVKRPSSWPAAVPMARWGRPHPRGTGPSSPVWPLLLVLPVRPRRPAQKH